MLTYWYSPSHVPRTDAILVNNEITQCFVTKALKEREMFVRSQGLLPCHSFSFSPRRRFDFQTEILVLISLLFYFFSSLRRGDRSTVFLHSINLVPRAFFLAWPFQELGGCAKSPQDPPSYSSSDSPNSQSFPEVRLGTESLFFRCILHPFNVPPTNNSIRSSRRF